MQTVKIASTLALALLTLAACSKKEEHNATQVVAKINGKEITVHQINAVLSRSPNIPAEKAKAASKQILQGLIDQELLVQQAQEQKIDRDANVMQAIEATRRDILARAYLERMAGKPAKPSANEIKQFYKEHPELFAERKIFQLNELALVGSASELSQLKPALEKAKTMADVLAMAKEKNLSVAQSQATKPAEQIELEILPALTKLKEGELGYLPMNSGIRVIQVMSTTPSPMDEATAQPRIEQFLMLKKRNDSGADEVKRLRAAAKIEYVGEYANDGAQPAATPPTPAVEGDNKTDDASMSRGVSGLK